MQNVLLVPVVSVAVLLSVVQNARSTTINFDTTPGGAAIAAGTNVSSTYASEGVTFSVIPCSLGVSCLYYAGTAPVAANIISPYAASPPNVIGISAIANVPFISAINEQAGILKATFSTPQSSVSIDVYPVFLDSLDNSAAPYLKAFNSSGTLLATAITEAPPTATVQTLTVSGTGIAYVEFSAPVCSGAGCDTFQFGYFDNLIYGGSGGSAPLISKFSAGIAPGSALFLTTLGPDGAVWFTDYNNGKIGRITPAGTVTEYSASTFSSPRPAGITVGPDGALWYTESGTNRVGRMDPLSGTVTAEYNVGTEPWGIVTGPDGAMWIAELGAGKIGRIDTQGKYTESSAISATAQPYNITLGPDGNLWFTDLFGSVGKITPAMAVTDYGGLPNEGPNGIVAGPDGNLWFTEFNHAFIGRITPAGTITQFPIPAGWLAEGITSGPDGNLWFGSTGTSNIGSITTEGVVNTYPAPGTSPNYVTVGPDGALWFSDVGQIERVVLPGTQPVILTYPIQSGDSASSLTLGGDNAIWFGITQGAIGRITLAGGMTNYPIPLVPRGNPSPTGIALGVDGALWFTETNEGQVGRITPNGQIEYALPNGINSEPYQIVSGPDGALWFTQAGIGRIDVLGGITEYPTPGTAVVSPSFGLAGIALGPDGALWFTEYVGNQIGRITTEGVVTAYPLAAASPQGNKPYGITAGPDGALWFTAQATGNIGRITTSGSISFYPIPRQGAQPLDIAVGPDGALWFTEEDGSRVGRLDPTSTSVVEYPTTIPSDSPGVGIISGPDGAVWFAAAGIGGTIGRISLPPANNASVTKIITTNPPGLTVTVDGANYTAPAIFNWPLGARHTIGVVVPPNTSSMDYEFGGWSDGNALQTHVISVGPGPMIHVANVISFPPPSVEIQPASVKITIVPGGYLATLTVVNNGNTTANIVHPSAAKLASSAGVITSADIVNLAPGATGIVSAQFPSSVASGPAAVSLSGTYSAGTLNGAWGFTLRVTVP